MVAGRIDEKWDGWGGLTVNGGCQPRRDRSPTHVTSDLAGPMVPSHRWSDFCFHLRSSFGTSRFGDGESVPGINSVMMVKSPFDCLVGLGQT